MRRWSMVLVCAVVCIAAACGSDGDSSATSPGAGSTPPGTAVTQTGAGEVSWLLVIDAPTATSDGSTLTLSDVEGRVTLFSDRPVRDVTRTTPAELLQRWDEMFASDPPNAVVAWSVDGVVLDAVVELSDPRLDGTTLTFSYVELDEAPDRLASLSHTATPMPAEMADVSLFVDAAAPLWREVSVTVVNKTGVDIDVGFGSVLGGDSDQRKVPNGSEWEYQNVPPTVGGLMLLSPESSPFKQTIWFLATNPLVGPVTVYMQPAEAPPGPWRAAVYSEGQTRTFDMADHHLSVHRANDSGGAKKITITVEP